MKICFVCDSYPTLPFFGGIDVYVQTAARALAARGHEVHVLITRRGLRFDTHDGPVQLHARPVYWIPVLAPLVQGLGESACAAWALWKLHRKFQFHIVEFPNWEGIGFVASVLRLMPIVVRLHTSTKQSLSALNRAPRTGERFMMWAESTSARAALATVTHSVSHREQMKSIYGLSEIRLIPHGIAVPPLDEKPESPAILSVGPLNARKGIDTLLAAIPLVLKAVPQAQFWVVGSDKDRRKAREFESAHPEISSDQVRFMGRVSPDQLSDLYSRCAVYASAAVYESFGLSFVEAMAHAKPVVGCAVSAMVEVIQHDATGLLVPANDAQALAETLIRLLRDAELRRRLGNAGHQAAAQKFSDKRMASEIEEFYLSVLNHQVRSSASDTPRPSPEPAAMENR